MVCADSTISQFLTINYKTIKTKNQENKEQLKNILILKYVSYKMNVKCEVKIYILL